MNKKKNPYTRLHVGAIVTWSGTTQGHWWYSDDGTGEMNKWVEPYSYTKEGIITEKTGGMRYDKTRRACGQYQTVYEFDVMYTGKSAESSKNWTHVRIWEDNEGLFVHGTADPSEYQRDPDRKRYHYGHTGVGHGPYGTTGR
tara:strand:- start:103 stop:528 length:426 start_codon:yes stop_codon:yes gene_type:complete